jgi:hypothetical protein
LICVAGAGLANTTLENQILGSIGLSFIMLGISGAVAVDIWSIVDATRVAKVNNLAWRDVSNTGFTLRLEPYISPILTYSSAETQLGLRIKVNF